MTREQAIELIKSHMYIPPRGSTYLVPPMVTEAMIETVLEAYDTGLRNGRLIARDWE